MVRIGVLRSCRASWRWRAIRSFQQFGFFPRMNRKPSVYGWLLATLTIVGLATALWPDAGRTWGLVANTARLVAVTCAISIPLGTGLACLLARTDLPGRRAMFVALAWLLFVPLYVQTGAWQAGFGMQGWQTLAGFGAPWGSGTSTNFSGSLPSCH